MRRYAEMFSDERFDLVGPIRTTIPVPPDTHRRPNIRAYKLRQQPVAVPSIRASGFLFVTVSTLF
jgi:hypothetical protein